LSFNFNNREVKFENKAVRGQLIVLKTIFTPNKRKVRIIGFKSQKYLEMTVAFKSEIKSEGMTNNGESSASPITEFPAESKIVTPTNTQVEIESKMEDRFISSEERFRNVDDQVVKTEGVQQPQPNDEEMSEVERYFSTVEEDIEDNKTLETENKNAYGGNNNIISYNPNNQAATLLQEMNKVYQQSELDKQAAEQREMVYQDAIINNTKDLINMGEQINQTNNDMVMVNNDLQTTKTAVQNDMLQMQSAMMKQMQFMMEQFTKTFEEKLAIIETKLNDKYDNVDAQTPQAQILNQNKQVEVINQDKVNQHDLEKVQNSLRTNILDTKDLESKIARLNIHSVKSKDIQPLE